MYSDTKKFENSILNNDGYKNSNNISYHSGNSKDNNKNQEVY
jgi:hypothetical protein